jgi:hypothetical protein
MYLVFYKTSDVFAAEEKLQSIGVATKIVPTPVQDKAYCGVCVYSNMVDIEKVKEALDRMDYQIV